MDQPYRFSGDHEQQQHGEASLLPDTMINGHHNQSIRVGDLHLDSSLDDHHNVNVIAQKDRSGSSGGSGLDEDFDFLHNHQEDDEHDRKIVSNARRFIDTSADVPIEGFSPVEEEEPSTLSPSQNAFVEDLVQLATKESQIILNEQRKLEQQREQKHEQEEKTAKQEEEELQQHHNQPNMASKLVTFDDEEPHRHDHKVKDEEPIEQSTYSRSGPLLIGAGHAQTQQQQQAQNLATSPAAAIIEQQQQAVFQPQEQPSEPPPSPKAEIITPPPAPHHENVQQAPATVAPQAPPRFGPQKETPTSTDNLQTQNSCCLMNGKQICDLVHWRDAKKSAMVFAPIFLLLVAAVLLPFLTLVCYVALICILTSITLQTYSFVMRYLVKDDQQSSVEKYLHGDDWQLDQSNLAHFVQPLLNQWNLHSNRLQDILLAKNIKEALLVAFCLWIFAYFTLYISLPSLILLGFVGFFTLPKFYEVYKQPIDKSLNVGREKFNELYTRTQNKVSSVMSSAKKNEIKKD